MQGIYVALLQAGQEGVLGAAGRAAGWFIGLFQAGADTFIGLVTGIIPLLIVLLTAFYAITNLIGEERIQRTARFAAASRDGEVALSARGNTYALRIVPVIDAVVAAGAAASGGPRVTAPMPGLVNAVEVATGDAVSQGQVVVVMEAMKVVMRLPAPVAGRVARVACAPGETVKGGDLLVEIEPATEA